MVFGYFIIMAHFVQREFFTVYRVVSIKMRTVPKVRLHRTFLK